MTAAYDRHRADRRAWYAALAGVTTLLGTSPLIVRTVDLPAAAITFVRAALGAAVLGVVLALGRGRAGDVAARRPRRMALAAAVLGVHWLTEFAALKRAPVATVILIVYLAPIGVAALAPRVLGERNDRRTHAALALAVGGLALVAGPGARGADVIGLALAGTSAALFVVLILVSKPLASAYGGIRFTFLQLAGAALVLLPGAATAPWGPPRAAWAWLGVLGAVHTAFAIGVYFSALAHLPATHVGVLSYLEPVSVAAFAWVVLGESLSAWTIMGGVLVVTAGALVATAPVAAAAAGQTAGGGPNVLR